MNQKKEMYVWIAFIVAVAAFILLLPTIDDYVSGRHKLRENTTSTSTNNTGKKPTIQTNSNNQQKDVTTELTCSLPEVDVALSTISKSIVFHLKNDILKSGEITKLYKHENKEDYEVSKAELKKVPDAQFKGTGYEITSTFDETKFTYTLKITIDYSKFVKESASENTLLEDELEYPTTTSKLETYLKDNDYTCKKKTS